MKRASGRGAEVKGERLKVKGEIPKMKGERLDKVLAGLGLGSRKDVKELIRSRRVAVEGKIADDPGMHVVPGTDLITVDGTAVRYRKYVYLMLNKPKGVISASRDGRERTVADLAGDEYRAFKLFPVGRLDKDTEGLIILTNDGDFAHEVLSPRKHVSKTYYAEVSGAVDRSDVESFRLGITLEDGYTTLPAALRILESGEVSKIEIEIREGKFHQIKRMFRAVGKEVIYLKRIAMGGLKLDPSLRPGEFRELAEDEIHLAKGGRETGF